MGSEGAGNSLLTTAVVLIDELIKGVWDYQTQNSQTTVTIEMFEPPTNPIQQGIAAEASRMGEFLNTQVVLEYGLIK